MKVIKKEDYIEDLVIQIPLQKAIENNTIDAIPLDKVKKAREDIQEEVFRPTLNEGYFFTADKVSECMAILDKLIESEVENER